MPAMTNAPSPRRGRPAALLTLAAALAALVALPACSTEQPVVAPSAPAEPTRFASEDGAPRQIGLCMACHGRDGMASAIGTPHLAGQDATYLASALRAYRDGSRRSNPMNGIANALVDSDIDALAAWYAAQPYGGAAAPAPAASAEAAAAPADPSP
jgi:cytochrome c553